MKPYNSNARCTKCGCTNVGQRFEGSGITRKVGLGLRWTASEVIRRNCIRCGYEWDEQPLDAVGKAALGVGGRDGK